MIRRKPLNVTIVAILTIFMPASIQSIVCKNLSNDQIDYTKFTGSKQLLEYQLPFLFASSGTDLGGGSYGKVRSAYWVAIYNRIAIKKISSKVFKEFEIESLSRLNKHGSFLKLYVCAIYNDHHYLGIEQINGESINNEKLMKDIAELKGYELVNFFLPLFKALEVLEMEKIVHNDIKPANIVATYNRSAAFLIDFGLARRLDLVSDKLTGSPITRSPRRFKANMKDFTSLDDLYSLVFTILLSTEEQ
jgi:serine/threonine protein kinase